MYSNFPQGFNGGLAVRNLPIAPAHPRKAIYVGNNATVLTGEKIASDTANKGGFLDPFSTLDYAVGQAKSGDIIYVRPGYTQSVTGADAVDVDVAGVTIIGLGRGTTVPKFTYNNSAGEFVIGAANVRIENLWFVPSVTGITKAIDIESGSHFAEIVGCRFGDAEAAGTDEFNATIIVAAASTDVKILNNYINMGEAGAVAGITITGACDRIEIRNNVIIGDYSTANINSITALQNDVIIKDNILVNGVTGGLNTEPTIELLTGSSGVIANNYSAANVATLAAHQVNDTAVNFQNYFTEDRGSAATAAATSASITASADD
jgi:hypothetical protein